MGCDEKPTVASAVWSQDSLLHEVQGKVVENLGYRHRFFNIDEPIPDNTGVVLVQGPYGSLLPLAKQLVRRPSLERPLLVYWFQQSLQFSRSQLADEMLARAFSDLYRSLDPSEWVGRGLARLLPTIMLSRGSRLGFLGDILWLHKRGLLDVLGLSSTFYADYFQRRRIKSCIVPRGYHPSYGQFLGLERDIAAVWMGKLRTERRRRALYWVRDELKKHGQVMHIYDGEENDFIYGEKRTQILNRAKFVLNVFFSGPTDELSIRFYIAGANGAVVLTEPGLDKYPFIPGKHLVECPIQEMPARIMYYVAHESEWQAISQNMLEHLERDLTLEQSVGLLLQQAVGSERGRQRA